MLYECSVFVVERGFHGPYTVSQAQNGQDDFLLGACVTQLPLAAMAVTLKVYGHTRICEDDP